MMNKGFAVLFVGLAAITAAAVVLARHRPRGAPAPSAWANGAPYEAGL